MDLAWLSLAALLVVVVVSCTTRVNPGVLAVVLAWLIGLCPTPDGPPLGTKEVLAGFPGHLFLTLVGVTLLFALAQDNGTLDRVARRAVGLCRGRPALVPVVFFLLAAALAAGGAGNIAAAALVAPMAMATAARLGLRALPMAVMVAHGAIAGAMSPFGPSGVIAGGLLRDRIGLAGAEWVLFAHNFAANAAVALAGYLLLGGWRQRPDAAATQPDHADAAPLSGRQWATLAVIGSVMTAAVGFGADVGMAAFAGSAVLAGLRLADERRAIQAMPWGVILMVCGVIVLTSLLEKTGGAAELARLVGRVATPQTAPAVMGLVAGVVSVYSSTTGVVLPAFLPLVPVLIAQLGGGDPLTIASGVVVVGFLVDSSPLSTIGALGIASAGPAEDRRLLFNGMLAWGLSMAVVGAAVFLLIGLMG